jgi:Tol biopolymer transport system component
MDPRLSPDDRQLAFTSAIGSSLDVLLHIFSNGSLQQLTTHPGEDFDPVWSPDGKHLAIASEVAEDAQNQGPGIAALPIEANRPPDPITRTPGYGHWEMPSSWSPSGWLAFSRNQGRSARDVWVRRMGDAEAEEQEIIGGPADEAGAVFSPDGEWIAYSSDELSGRPDIYVRPFKRAGRTHPISSDGGVEPLWSRDGRELFYRSGDRLMAVNVGLGPELQPAPPRTLFAGRFEMKGFGSGSANYDVARGGRFVMVQRKNLVRPTVIEVVLNWPALQPAVSK